MQKYIATSVQRWDSNILHLQELRHGRRCWLGFFSSSSSKILLQVVDGDGRTPRSASEQSNGRGELVAGWPKLAGERMKSDGTVELKGR
jgi:hypothetical protein